MRLIPFKPLVLIPPGTKIRFTSHYKFAIIETIILLIATVVLLSTLGLNLGIDFRGGTMMEIRTTNGPADIADIRQKVGALDFGDTQIQTFGAVEDVMIRLPEQPGGEKAQQEAVAKVRAALGDNIEVRRVEVVGATVSQELLQTSVIALAIAAVGIFLFVWMRFEWQFSVCALTALAHDVLAVLCVLSLLQINFDLTVVAGLLTLIGYAVNDTVVIFDRIRENLRRFKVMPLDDLIDQSLNETLSRTVSTTSCVLITLLALYFFGGEVIHNFIFTLLIGSLVSAYTSLFVASPLLYILGVKRDWSGTATQPVRAGRTASAKAASESKKGELEVPSGRDIAAAAKSNPIAGADPELAAVETGADVVVPAAGAAPLKFERPPSKTPPKPAGGGTASATSSKKRAASRGKKGAKR